MENKEGSESFLLDLLHHEITLDSRLVASLPFLELQS